MISFVSPTEPTRPFRFLALTVNQASCIPISYTHHCSVWWGFSKLVSCSRSFCGLILRSGIPFSQLPQLPLLFSSACLKCHILMSPSTLCVNLLHSIFHNFPFIIVLFNYLMFLSPAWAQGPHLGDLLMYSQCLAQCLAWFQNWQIASEWMNPTKSSIDVHWINGQS